MTYIKTDSHNIQEGWALDLKYPDTVGPLIKDTGIPYPDKVFSSYKLPAKYVKVIILGQDPYMDPCLATGIAFGVPLGTRALPPSLRNIFNELEACGYRPPKDITLEGWLDQGVMLLNTSLTVEPWNAGSHKGYWNSFIKKTLHEILFYNPNVIVVSWGNNSKEFVMKWIEDLTGMLRHIKAGNWLTSSHPSPLSVNKTNEPFLGCRHFKKINDLLKSQGDKEIDWSL